MIEEQLAAKYTRELIYSIQIHVLSHNVFSLHEAHNLAFEAEKMMIWSSHFMRFFGRTRQREPQQLPTEEQSTKKDLSSTDMHVPNNQVCDQDI